MDKVVLQPCFFVELIWFEIGLSGGNFFWEAFFSKISFYWDVGNSYHATLSESDYCLTTNALENITQANILLKLFVYYTQQKLAETECPRSRKYILIGKVN